MSLSRSIVERDRIRVMIVSQKRGDKEPEDLCRRNQYFKLSKGQLEAQVGGTMR